METKENSPPIHRCSPLVNSALCNCYYGQKNKARINPKVRKLRTKKLRDAKRNHYLAADPTLLGLTDTSAMEKHNCECQKCDDCEIERDRNSIHILLNGIEGKLEDAAKDRDLVIFVFGTKYKSCVVTNLTFSERLTCFKRH